MLQETISEPEGLSFEPDQWRDYMLDRMSNDGTTSSTPSASASASSTSLASDGNATPIMAASPAAQQDQPLISPDSLLDPLEDHQPALFPPPTPLRAPPPPPCPECEQEQQQQQQMAEEVTEAEEELELVVEIKDMDMNDSGHDDNEDGNNQKVSYVASMGPVGGEDSISDNHMDNNTITVGNNSDSGHQLSATAVDKDDTFQAAGPIGPVETEVATMEAAVADVEDEANSETEYAKEVEPELKAEAHLMADIQFSQQKLHELLNQLEKQNRYPAISSSSASGTTSEESLEDKKEEAAVVLEEKEQPSPPREVTPPSKEATPPTEDGDQKTETPERRGSGDQEISDHIDRAKLRKCSSLKSGRTPPGTPGVRKIVR